jgi:hypothetical protein
MTTAFDAEDVALGRAALARGLLTREQLDLALAEQARVAAAGTRESLGQVLVRGRMITAEHFAALRLQSTAPGTPTPATGVRRPAPAGAPPDAPTVTEMVALVPGALVGPWRLEREIGRGGMGIIFTARREGSGELVALKVLRDPGRASLVQRFVRETTAVARLDHPNIVRLIEDGKAGDLPWYAMEFVDGATLDDLAQRPDAETAFPVRRRVEIVRDVARAVAYAHERGVIHRDLKPANILISREGVAKVTDFGLAKLEDEERKLTRTGAALGTPRYMSPEQIRGQPVDRRTDVWALGVILYELIEGNGPFESEDLQDLYARIAESAPTAPIKVPGLGRVALKAIEKDPADRYPDAIAFANDLEGWLRGAEPTVTGPTIARRVSRWTAARKPVIVGAGIALAVTLPLLVVFALKKPVEPRATGPGPAAPAPLATAAPAARAEDPTARANKLLAEALQFRLDHPDDAKAIEERFRSIADRYGSTDAGRVAAQSLRDVHEEHARIWQAGLDGAREDARELMTRGDYVAAAERIAVFLGREGIDADVAAEAHRFEQEVAEKARKAVDDGETSVRARLAVPDQAERVLEDLRMLKLPAELAATRDAKATALTAEIASAREKLAANAAVLDAKKRTADLTKLALATAASGDLDGAAKSVQAARADASLAPAKADLDALAAQLDRLVAGEAAVKAALEALPDGPVGPGLSGKVESVDTRALELHVKTKSGKKTAPLARVPAERLLAGLDPSARAPAGEWLLLRGAATLATAALEQAGDAGEKLLPRAREAAAGELAREAEADLDRAVAEASRESVSPEAALETIKAAVDEHRSSPAYASRRDKLLAVARAARAAQIARDPSAFFRGKAKLDAKTGAITLAYDWKNADETADWEAEPRWPGAKLELKKGAAAITGKVRLVARFVGPVHLKATVIPLDEAAPNVNVLLHDQGGWGGLLVGLGFKAATYTQTRLAADAQERAGWIVKLPGLVLLETFEPDAQRAITTWKCDASGDWHPSLLPAGRKARIEIQKEDKGILVKLNGSPVLGLSRPLYPGAIGSVSFVPESSGLVVQDLEVKGKLDAPWVKERAAAMAQADAEALVPPVAK